MVFQVVQVKEIVLCILYLARSVARRDRPSVGRFPRFEQIKKVSFAYLLWVKGPTAVERLVTLNKLQLVFDPNVTFVDLRYDHRGAAHVSTEARLWINPLFDREHSGDHHQISRFVRFEHSRLKRVAAARAAARGIKRTNIMPVKRRTTRCVLMMVVPVKLERP